jgi:CHAT domain-containing protein
VGKEIDALTGLLPDPRTLTGPAATHHTVADAIASHPIAHFSCHGLANLTNPAASKLLLHDHATQPLTVAALAKLRKPGLSVRLHHDPDQPRPRR